MNAPRDKSFSASLEATLTDPAEAAVYIDAAMELDDPAALLVALRHVAKAHGMAEVARRADVGDKTLFKALSDKGNIIAGGIGHLLPICRGVRLALPTQRVEETSPDSGNHRPLHV